MMIGTRLHIGVLFTAILIGGLAQTAVAKNRVTLAQVVPADSWLYVHQVDNPERDFLDKHWSHVFKELKAAHLEKDIKNLFMQNLQSEEERADFNRHWDKAVELYNQVKWSDLAGPEFVLMSRKIAPVPDFTVLFRPRTETLEQNVQGLKTLLEEFAALDEKFHLSSETLKNAKLWTLNFEDAPVTINLFHRDQIVGLALGRQSAEQTIALLAGDNTKGRLIDSSRYKQAIAGVPTPEDSITFVDMAKLFSQIRGAIPTEPKTPELTGHQEAQGPTGSDLLQGILDHFDFVDYIVSSEETKGLQTYTHTVVTLTEAGKNKPLCKILTNQKPLNNLTKYVPQDVKGYWAWSGLDLEAAYDLVLDFIAKNVPDGQEALTQWEEVKTESGFDPKVELFSWLGGQIVGLSFPPAIQSPFAKADWLWMIKVSDDQKAMATINKTLNSFNANFQGDNPNMNPGLIFSPAADVKAERFRTVTHPLLAMLMMKITYGVYDGWLMVSNSSTAINKVLATSRGETPSFLESERFKKEGLAPKGPVAFASYSDLRTLGQDLATGLMIIPLASMAIPPRPETQPIRTILGMLGKLSPVVSKIDFMLSSSSVCTFEGNRWVARQVTSYRKYVPPSERKPLTTQEGEQKQEKKRKLDGL